MSPNELAAVRFWSHQVGRDPHVAAELEELVPWVFCGEGVSEQLAPSLFAEAMGPLQLSERDVRLLARALNAYTEWEPGDPTDVPDRQATADKLSDLVRQAGRARGRENDVVDYVDSINSF